MDHCWYLLDLVHLGKANTLDDMPLESLRGLDNHLILVHVFCGEPTEHLLEEIIVFCFVDHLANALSFLAREIFPLQRLAGKKLLITVQLVVNEDHGSRNEQALSAVCFRESAFTPRALAPTQGKDR